jgi:FGGY-family pentulose kinase
MSPLLLAVDVGTREARAGAFDECGRLVGIGSAPLDLIRPDDQGAVYRMDAVWSATCGAIRACLAGDAAPGMRVVGLGFGATPALVLIAEGAPPLEDGADVLASLDRRATAEAREINSIGGPWLDRFGGALSAERHLPRLLWLRRHLPDTFRRLRGVRDLCDELTRRATGDDRHALATLGTLWPYEAGAEDPWRHDAWTETGLEDVWGLGALSGDPVLPAAAQGGLRADVAEFLGLTPGIPVAAGMPDAIGGLLGSIGRNVPSRLDRSLVLVGGHATTMLALSAEERDIPGVHGPALGVPFGGLRLHQTGQADTAAALDALLESHPAGPGHATAAGHCAAAAEILGLLEREGPAFAARRHCVPDRGGSRAPLDVAAADAQATGLCADRSPRGFLETYYAIARAHALWVRHIVGHLAGHGMPIECVCVAGGQAHNPLIARLYRDAIGLDLVVTRQSEPVLLGVAMSAAVAAGVYPDLPAALDVMAPPQARLAPDPSWRRAHEIAYGIYQRLFEARNEIARAADGLARLAGQAW